MAHEQGKLTVEQAATRFGRLPRYHQEIVQDAASGTACVVTYMVVSLKDRHELSVCVTPYPRTVRKAKCFQMLADFIDGFKNGPSCYSVLLSL